MARRKRVEEHMLENIKMIRSNRKSIAIEVRLEGILLRIPYSMSEKEVTAFLQEKQAWIAKHKKQMEEKKEQLQALTPYTKKEIQALADKAMRVIPERVKYYAKLIDVEYGRITIRNQKSRWGSCSSKGNLNFNCLLMMTPDEVIDSVVVHELCHRKHMNHSKQFYEEITKVFPQYAKCDAWLKEHGTAIFARMR